MDRLRPLSDFVFKKIMGETGDEEQLISFLNAVLARTGRERITSLEIVEHKELPPDIVGDKAGRLDVFAKFADGTKANIEIQLKNEHNMDKRTLYYWSWEYVHSIKAGGLFNDLPTVITINILNFEYLATNDFHSSFHLYEDRNKDLRLTDVMEIHFIEMKKFDKLKDKDIRNNPLHRWLTYLNEKSPVALLKEAIKMDPVLERAQEKMDIIQRDPDLLRAYFLYNTSVMGHNNAMFHARKEGEVKGLKKGLKEGRKEGLEKGLNKGNKQGRMETARNGKKMGLSMEQIAVLSGLSEKELRNL
jgi:predicted transposase/invertase (TIGR01784 family)